MHVKLGVADKKTGAGEVGLVFLVVTYYVAGVLAQPALDALAELLRAFHVWLVHGERGHRLVGRRAERRDLARLLVVEGDIRDEVLDDREGPQGGDGHRLAGGEDRQPGHAHQPGFAVDLRRTGPAFAGFTVPAHGQVVGLGRLSLVHGVQHDLAFLGRHHVLFQPASVGVPTPYTKRQVVAQWSPSNSSANSGGGLGKAWRRDDKVAPASAPEGAASSITTFWPPQYGSVMG